MYAAVDIGGTKTLVAAFTQEGQLRSQVKFPTDQDYSEFITSLGKAVSELGTIDFRTGVVAVPGRVDREEGVGIAFGNLPWENVPIQADAEKILNCPMRIENDANLAGLSEAILLKGQFKKVLYVTISTGIGGVLVVDGKMDDNTLDAEIGHILLEHDGRLMRWEEFASGKAIVAKFGKRASEIDPDDTQTWYVIARNIAVGLIDIIATLTPEVIVLGGGVGTHLPKFRARLMEQLEIYDNPMLTIPAIRQANNPEEAVIYGCYELAKSHHEKTAR